MSPIRTATRILKTSAIAVAVCASRALCEKSAKTDPLDCAVPACADMAAMFKKSLNGVDKNKKDTGNKSAIGGTSSIQGVPREYSGCPVDKNELGDSSWVLLHTIAANYPERPTSEQQQLMIGFITALAAFYPCVHCAADFQETVKLSPPRVASRKDLALWMCEQHNVVNAKLGKPQFPCELTALDERWRVSRRSECWPKRELGDLNADATLEGAQS